MKKIKVGDVWQGCSYVDMINKVLGTNYKMFMKASVPMNNYGIDGIVWFIYMNGSEHFNFSNIISEDGDIIKEIIDNVNNRNSGKNYTLRLAFMRDPENNGNAYKCKFVGYFKRFDISGDSLVRTYKKVDDYITF